jgi:NAD(P)-dependent dehydrogenase (short-subunit alcohol dehydrogenase family)
MKNQKKIAVISGATGYVGFEVAKKLADDGMTIAMMYRTNPKKDVARMLSELSGKGHLSYACDIADKNSVAKTIDMIEKEMGNIYACVHTAGTIPKPKQLHLSSEEDLREQFEVNIFGSFNFLSTCALRLKEHKKGVVIGITTASVATQVNTKARGAYSVTKFALQGMLVALKEELTPYHIRVYSIAPGVMAGGMNQDTPKAFIEIVRHSSPTKTLASAKDIANKISYLCSDTTKDEKKLTFLIAPETGIA